MCLKEERPVGWPRQRMGEGPDMKLERVAGANPPGLVGLHVSYVLIM